MQPSVSVPVNRMELQISINQSFNSYKQILFLLLLVGYVTVANSFGLDLRFLSPWRSSDEGNEQPLPPMTPTLPNMCKPQEPMTLIRNTRAAQLLRPGQDFSTGSVVPLPTLAPANNPGDLSTRRPLATPTTRQISRNGGDEYAPANPSNDCEPLPMGIGTRLSAQLLKILTILG